MVPRFDVTRMVWLEHGGIFAVANIRGGGEFGDGLASAGRFGRTNKLFLTTSSPAPNGSLRNIIRQAQSWPSKADRMEACSSVHV